MVFLTTNITKGFSLLLLGQQMHLTADRVTVYIVYEVVTSLIFLSQFRIFNY
jgi:hypothetical protein